MSTVDIIVPTCGQTEFTRRCFESIRNCTDLYRVIWIDNGSSYTSRKAVMEELTKMPQHMAVWSSERLGFVGATNLGLRMALDIAPTDSPYVAFLNNDVEVTPGWLSRMVDLLDKEPDIHAVGPIASECQSWQSYTNAGKVVPVFQIPRDFDKQDLSGRAQTLAYVYGDLWRPCSMLAFFCTVIRKDVFKVIGRLDKQFEEGLGDDDDFCKRMRDAHMQCALSMGTYVFHNHRTTFAGLYSDQEIDALSQKHHDLYRKKHGEEAKV
jgi:GT2 family glycosyltransferase